MEIKNPEPRFKVTILECDRWSGIKVDEVKYFTTEPSAKGFCEVFNSDNDPSKPTPEWYMIATYDGRVV